MSDTGPKVANCQHLYTKVQIHSCYYNKSTKHIFFVLTDHKLRNFRQLMLTQSDE